MELVVTLGPASASLVRELAGAGASAFRLNASHLDVRALVEHVGRVRAVSELPIVVDLQGAKMRVGEFPARRVRGGELVRFGVDVPLPHPELFSAVTPGEQLSLDDGRLRCEVLEVRAGELVARWLTDGVLAPRKGINRASHPLEPRQLSARDREQVEATRGAGGVSYAFSFLCDGRELAWLEQLAPGCPTVAKIERAEAVASIGAIVTRAASTWICRGDLGSQLGEVELARFVARYRPPPGAKVLMAGQVLQHISVAPEPTRSEVCHLFDLLGRGYAGIVLSDETATGAAPLDAVRTARRLLDELRA